MGTRTVFQVPPTAATIALNAYIFGYAGHSLVTPHAALKQLWWTDDRIERRVTRHFVVSQIRGEEREFLDKPLGFGEGLTDETYMEWILSRARRLFLILAEIGKPEQIFGLIDDSLDDEDLPLTYETIEKLELSIEPDDRLNRKCYDTQFLYLLRQLKKGSHIDYGPTEFIPMEPFSKVPPAVQLQCWDRIHFPGNPDRIFMRRKITFGSDDMRDVRRSGYALDIEKAKYLRHEHICPIWASYTTDEAGYVLSDFVPEHTLGSFMAQRMPYQFMRIQASERPVVVLEWLHCLCDAIASLHHRGTYHGAIRPNNIVIDHDNRIAFADVGTLTSFQKGKKVEKKEILEHAAPEVYIKLATPRGSKTDAIARMNSEDSSSSGGSVRSTSVSNSSTTSPVSSPVSIPASLNTSAPKLSRGMRNFSRHLSQQSTISECVPLSEPINATPALPPPEEANGRVTSLASIIAAATGNITTITPSLPPPTPEELSPRSFTAPWASDKDRTGSDSAHTRPNKASFHNDFSPMYPPPLFSSSPPPPSSPSSPLARAIRSLSASARPTASTFAFPAINSNPMLHKTSSTSALELGYGTTDVLASSSLPEDSLNTLPLHPEAGDMFSLGCVFLDVLTWLVKGRLNEFHRFRAATPPSSETTTSSAASVRSTRSTISFLPYKTLTGASAFGVSSSSNSSGSGSSMCGTASTNNSGGSGGRMDSSYAAQLPTGKLDTWISELRSDSLRKLSDQRGLASSSNTVNGRVENEAIWVNGVPELLRIVKSMLQTDPEERPCAREVRDAVETVLGKGCCMRGLCCQGREWEGCGDDKKQRRNHRGSVAQQGAGAEGVGKKDGAGEEIVDAGVDPEEPQQRSHVRSLRIDEAVQTNRSGGVPVRKRVVNLPWRKR